MEELAQSFKKRDRDNDGIIIDKRPPNAPAPVDTLDLNHDGKVTPEEYFEYYMAYDANKDGEIAGEEITSSSKTSLGSTNKVEE